MKFIYLCAGLPSDAKRKYSDNKDIRNKNYYVEQRHCMIEKRIFRGRRHLYNF